VWQALVDHRAFGDWFGFELEEPFEEGSVSVGRPPFENFEGHEWRVLVEAIERARAKHLSFLTGRTVMRREALRGKFRLTTTPFSPGTSH
jgi:hypothetical protein